VLDQPPLEFNDRFIPSDLIQQQLSRKMIKLFNDGN